MPQQETDLIEPGENLGDVPSSRYELLAEWRRPFLDRARAVGALTIPTEIPREGHTPWETFPTPYQSAGSRGVSNLASKLGMTLFPPNTPFFTLDIDPFVLQAATGQADSAEGGKKIETELNETMLMIERSITSEIDRQHMRPSIQRALKHIVIGGNALLHIDDRLKARMFPMSRYVLVRDSGGDVSEIIVFESVDPRSLTLEERAMAEASSMKGAEKVREGKPVTVYTWIRRERRNDDGVDIMSQERWIEDIMVPDSHAEFRWDESPYIPLSVNRADEESYGRGVAEDFMGDLKTLEGLTRAAVEAAVAAARIVWLVKPGATIRIRSLATCPNGGFREGDVEDVGALKLDKNADMMFATNMATEVEKRLDEHFLVGKSVRRDAERVTAEEIGFMIQNLEDTQVGLFSTLAGDLQLKIVKRVMSIKRDDDSIPPLKQLPRELLDIKVIAGLEGLGRGHDLQRMRTAFQIIHDTLGADVVAQVIQQNEAISRILVASGVSPQGLVKTDEQQSQEQAQAQAQELASRAAPQLAQGVMAQAQQPQEA